MAVISNNTALEEDEEFKRTKAMLRLMSESQEGKKSGEEGYVSSEDVRSYFRSVICSR
jgi:hypothetical protein